MSVTSIEPLVSIIIPVYNAEEYLEESLHSVTEQSYRNLEIICVDDGSADGSPAILQRLKSNDPRIVVLSQENSGAGVARNLGMKEAKGEYILFFDADDLLRKNAVRTLVKTAVRNNTDIVLFHYYKFSGSRKMRVSFSAGILKVPLNRVIKPTDISDRLFQADHGMPWNKFYKADFLRNAGVLFQALKNTNDEFFSRITTVEANRILFLNKVFVGYRVGNNRSLQGNTKNHILDCTLAVSAICDELKNRGYYETYRETYQKLAGYILMLKLLATKDSESFKILATEISENILSRCELQDSCPEERFLAVYDALRLKDIERAESEIRRLK